MCTTVFCARLECGACAMSALATANPRNFGVKRLMKVGTERDRQEGDEGGASKQEQTRSSQ